MRDSWLSVFGAKKKKMHPSFFLTSYPQRVFPQNYANFKSLKEISYLFACLF